MLVNLFNTPLGVSFDNGFNGELFGFQFLSSYVLILDVGVLIGAATVTVTFDVDVCQDGLGDWDR